MASAGVAITGLAANMNNVGGSLGTLSQNATRAASAVSTATTGASTAIAGLAAQVPALKAALGAFIAFEAVTTVINLTIAAAEAAEAKIAAVVKMASQAQLAGVGTTFFQSLIGQAKELNTEVSTLQGYLTRAREASTIRLSEGNTPRRSSIQGVLEQDVRAGNIRRADLNAFNAAGDQEARIRVVLNLIERLKAEQRSLAAYDIARAFFGDDFETRLRSGVDVIGAMRKALDGIKTGDQGRILSPEEVSLAQRVNTELENSRKILADALVPLQKDILTYQNQQLIAMADFNTAINKAAASFLGLYGYVKQVGDAITRLGNASIFKTINEFFERNGMTSIGGVLKLENPPTGDTIDLPEIDVGKDDKKSKDRPSLRAPRTSAGTETDQVQTYIDSLNKANVALKAEVENYSKSNAEKAVAINLAKAQEIAQQNGKKLTDEQAEAIRKASSETANYKDKIADLEQAQRQAGQAARFFADQLSSGFEDALVDGKSLTDVVNSLSKSLARSSIQALLTGQGPLAGIFGTAPAASAGPNVVGGLFGGLTSFFRANGGPMEAGRAYTVGEMGRELFIPNQNGRMVPIERRAGGSIGGGVTVGGSTFHIDARGAQVGVAEQISTALRAYDAESSRTMGQRLAAWRDNN
jgi:hypothetical protein